MYKVKVVMTDTSNDRMRDKHVGSVAAKYSTYLLVNFVLAMRLIFISWLLTFLFLTSHC